ncbi:synaptic vesicle glycoprotein 2C-like [Lingula anatina]|uniref:Synaptic vesicle glycoprotein 2C-like n=1 Tax=Lingula anatina TaxID=7574 RepID=A0A1S3I2U7_LINAN|nr:synaptic vesicle glycoprotein 2C-like [Lingula anatina]|eukprot:XP_013391674.1 synaptic vesicle glycoprotein 2C-like [Lingula anatina]
MDLRKDESDGLLENDWYQETNGDQPADLSYTFEEALHETGYGCFHIYLLLLCGWAVSSDAIEVLCISFVLPSAEIDLNLSTNDKGWLTAIIFVGMLLGGYFWGSLADSYGRRSILLWSLTVNGLGGLLSSFAQRFGVFLLFRFISGIGVGGSIAVIFSYFVEFQPKDKRGTMISVLATFWMAGNIFAAGLAWAVIPHKFGYFSPSFIFDSWRVFVVLCTLPSFSSALMYILMPESPKFLMQVGKEREALLVFQRMYCSNNRKTIPTDFRIRKLRDVSRHQSDSDVQIIDVRNKPCGKFRASAVKVLEHTAQLFQPGQKRITLIVAMISFTLAFGYYGLWMWFPELFKRIELHGGSACENIGVQPNGTNHSTHEKGSSTEIFFDGFMTALSNLPGNLLSILLMDRVGRKFLLSSSMVISGISVFFIWFVKNKTESLIMSCIFGGISTIGWNALDVLSVELFPTHLRSTAMGVMTGLMRVAAILGNLAFGLMVDVHCAVPMLLVAGFLAFGGLSSILLPNTVHMDLQ